MKRQPRAIDHLAFRVSDMDEALHFYHDILGLEIDDEGLEYTEEEYMEGRGVRALIVGATRIHLWTTEGEPFEPPGGEGTANIPNNEHFCLAYPSKSTDYKRDLAELVSELREEGVEIVHEEPEPRPGPYGPSYRVHVRDPDGRDIELRMY